MDDLLRRVIARREREMDEGCTKFEYELWAAREDFKLRSESNLCVKCGRRTRRNGVCARCANKYSAMTLRSALKRPS